jgi:hypothetical protein
VVFSAPEVRTKLADDLEECYSEQKNVTRKSGTHTRSFRVKAATATDALDRLDSYLRGSMPVSGRLPINDIAVEGDPDHHGWFTGRAVYGNPDTKPEQTLGDGIVPAYGDRVSYSRNDSVTERIFEIRGYNDAAAALAALRSHVSSLNLEEISVDEDGGGAEQCYTGRVRYRKETGTEGDSGSQYQPSLSFEVGGSQTKMICSLGTVSRHAVPGRTPRDYGGLIGVTDDGVEGVDVDVPTSGFSETRFFYPEVMTAGFIAFLTGACGCVNDRPWHGFEEGEVRFLGVSGDWREGEELAGLTFRFAVSLNERDIQIGEMTIPFKYGWDYLWIRWQNQERHGVTVRVPVEAFVEEVYHSMDFRQLGIGS